MRIDTTQILLIIATVLTGLLAGISLDKLIVQLPARHRMRINEFAAFSKAADLGNGLILYAILGIGAAAFNILAAFSAFLQRIPLTHAAPLYISVLLALFHSFTTSRAAPNMLSLRKPIDDEALLTETFNRFAKWHGIRAVLQLLNFIVLLWALLAYFALK